MKKSTLFIWVSAFAILNTATGCQGNGEEKKTSDSATQQSNAAESTPETNAVKRTKFTVTFENISAKKGVEGSKGFLYPFGIAPLYWQVSKDAPAALQMGQPAGANLQWLAETGDPSKVAEFYSKNLDDKHSGKISSSKNGVTGGPIFSGDSFEFEIEAEDGEKLTLLSMYAQSNDLFYGSVSGINLFENDKPISGDVTKNFQLWDAGTEVNQEPGKGSYQAARQKSKTEGDRENGVIHSVSDGFVYPSLATVIKVTITAK
jgi:hypothetical protein